MNEELKEIYESDQQDRRDWSEGNMPVEEFRNRDKTRMSQVLEMIEKGTLEDGTDYYHASMIFQHGKTAEDYLKANELAKKAVELQEERAKWMVAATWDRYLTNNSGAEFQKYGTQYKKDSEEGNWYLYPVDPNTTDEERAEFNVRPLAELEAYVEILNKND